MQQSHAADDIFREAQENLCSRSSETAWFGNRLWPSDKRIHYGLEKLPLVMGL